MPRLSERETIARVCGITQGEVDGLLRDGIMPRPESGESPDVAECVRHYIQWYKDTSVPRFANADALGEFMEVSKAQVLKLYREGMPRVKRGRYDVKVCVVWYLDRLRSRVQGDIATGVKDERAKLVKEQTRRTRLEADKAERLQVPRDEVEDGYLEVAGVFKASLLAMAPRIASEIAGKTHESEIRKVIDAEAKRILGELSARFRAIASRLRGEVGRSMWFEDLERESFAPIFGERKVSIDVG